MNDVKRNELLKAAGKKSLSPRAVSNNGSHVKGLKLDANTFKAKKQIKGVEWYSLLNKSTESIEIFLGDKLSQLSWSSEYYEHFLSDIESVIAFGLENDMLSEDDISPFLNKTTDELVKARSAGQKVPTTPGILLIDFTTNIADASRDIREAIQGVIDLLKSYGLRTDFSKVTDRWVINKARQLRLLSNEDNDNIARLFDKKSRIMSYYKGQADMFRAGNSPLADAFAFAILWREVMISQSRRAKRHDDDAYESMLNKFESETGKNPRHDTILMKKLRDITPKYQYTKLSSVLNLFPTGALQFLDLIENKKITQYVKGPQNISGFFIHSEMDSSKLSEAKALEGKRVLLKDSEVLGSGFQLATEDYSQTGFISSTPRQKMMSENYPEEVIESVCEREYARGGRAFTGGYQLATVVYVETTRKDGKPLKGGIRLWMQDVQILREEEMVALLNNKN